MITAILCIAYLVVAIAVDDYFTPDQCKLNSRLNP